MAIYKLELLDRSGCDETIDINADSDAEAIEDAENNAEEFANSWCRDGEWGIQGASIDVDWILFDSDGNALAEGDVTVEIEPDHERLIANLFCGKWDRPEDWCGDDPEDHDWTSEGEGGCSENPGVWSTGGTSMVFKSHCRACNLRRTENHVGSQRNPGEHDTVEYERGDD